MKIVNGRDNSIMFEKETSAYEIFMDYVYKNIKDGGNSEQREDIGIGGIYMFDRLSDIVKTMVGDALTPFETIDEMMQYIPGIENYPEETSVLCIFGDKVRYYILGWDYEDDINLWDKILKDYNPNLFIEP